MESPASRVPLVLGPPWSITRSPKRGLNPLMDPWCMGRRRSVGFVVLFSLLDAAHKGLEAAPSTASTHCPTFDHVWSYKLNRATYLAGVCLIELKCSLGIFCCQIRILCGDPLGPFVNHRIHRFFWNLASTTSYPAVPLVPRHGPWYDLV